MWWFGFVSLAADMVYEGARSMYGPVLAALGASGLVVGLVTGAGEAVALVLRLVFGPVADRTGRYWSLTIVGYGLTAVCVPLLWFAPRLGAAGLAFAVVMILLERLGKAIRSPSKSALLAHAAGAVGRGRGFGVHKALDRVGAFAGPLVVAAVVAGASIWAGMAVLAIPGSIAMALLVALCLRVPDPSVYDPSAAPSSDDRPRQGWFKDALGADLPPVFFRYAFACALTTGALVTFGIIGYHLTVDKLVPVAAVPVVYAGAMAVEAVAALVVGSLYDRTGAKILFVVPVPVAPVPAPALGGSFTLVLVGVAVWGFAHGVQGLHHQGRRRRPRPGAASRDGVRRLRRHPGRAGDRRRRRGRLALRPVAARAGGRGRDQPAGRARVARDHPPQALTGHKVARLSCRPVTKFHTFVPGQHVLGATLCPLRR
ncbi:MFS transporter [Nocardioides sp. B-3]|uniref:MFS transporter n=1 Tax=Nocardioides sp. B-3 TaxID=2895565 RepID=UPI002152239A|nr:MFS transporter [Nocardioides sp. B-3]UUZ59135.1 MFS transporter [Nocardioides sp. B-3]